MIPRRSQQRNQALTLIEVVVLLASLTLLAALLLPDLTGPRSKVQRIACVNNIKQIGLACHVWANDNLAQYPLSAAVTNNGNTILLRQGVPDSELVLWSFRTMSNALSTPLILHCPADEYTTQTRTFDGTFSRSNISYFISLDASEDYPQMILSGDDNMLVNGSPVQSGILTIPTNAAVAWSNERHMRAGNIGLADGSAQQVTSAGMQQALQNAVTDTTNSFNRFAIP